MGYDFSPVHEEAGSFHMGAFLWPHFLEQCGWYFLAASKGARYFFVAGQDERMPEDDTYPRLMSNDGFLVTEEEAMVLARIAHNYVIMQQGLEDQPEDDHDIFKPAALEIWPRKVRDDWVEKLEEFSVWARKSGGFEIY